MFNFISSLLFLMCVSWAFCVCPRDCSMEQEQLVCATDGRTTRLFSSRCEFENMVCIAKLPWWEVKMKECCDFECIDLRDPVCGFDGATYRRFDNVCYMKKYNCLHGTRFEPVDSEKCGITGGPVLS